MDSDKRALLDSLGCDIGEENCGQMENESIHSEDDNESLSTGNAR